jgi:hypothetical protein
MTATTASEYKFNELSPTAKQKAIEAHASSLWDDWFSGTISEWQDKLSQRGYKDPEIRFSGFWSQGDGASFSCSLDFKGESAESFLTESHKAKLTAKRVEWKMDGYDTGEFWVFGTIHATGRYCHHNTMTLDDWDITFDNASTESKEFLDELSEDATELPSEIINEAKSLAQEIYKDLEKEYNYLTSEEYVALISSDNGYVFDENGNLL